MNEENRLIFECIRELLIDPNGLNKPKRLLLAELIDEKLCPKINPTIAERTHDALSEGEE